MIKSVTFLWIVLAVAVSGALFRVSYRVQHLQKHLVVVNRQIAQEQEKIRVLQAEWNKLNDPARLESLARRHLNMAPATPAQIVGIDVVPTKSPVPETATTTKLLAKAPAPAAPTVRPILASLKPGTVDD